MLFLSHAYRKIKLNGGSMKNTALAEKIRKYYTVGKGKENISDTGRWFMLGVKQKNIELTRCCLLLIRDWCKNNPDSIYASTAFVEAYKYTEFLDVIDDIRNDGIGRESSFGYSFNPFVLSPDEIYSIINDKKSALSLITEGTYAFILDTVNQEVPLGWKFRPDEMRCVLTQFVNSWTALDFTSFLEKHKDELMETENSFINLSYILESLVIDEKTESAFDRLFAFMKRCADEYGISWEKDDTLSDPLRTAVLYNNEHAFSALAAEAEEKRVKIVYREYPSKSLSILRSILSSSQLLPGTEDGKDAFYCLLKESNPSEEIVKMTYHQSYTDALSYAVQNTEFSSGLYPFIMTPHDDVNEIKDGNLSPLGYAIKCGNTKGVEKLLELGGDPLKTDKDGNTVLHRVCAGKNDGLQHIIKTLSFPVEYLMLENNKGKSPLDYLLCGGKLEL